MTISISDLPCKEVLSKDQLTPNFVNQRRPGSVLGIIHSVIPQVSPEPGIGPSQVRSGSGLLVLVTNQLDHVVSLGLVIRLDQSVIDEVITDLGIVPAGENGGLGLGVVVSEELLVLFTLEVSGRVGATSVMV
jgi:hypothetical protein